MNNTSNILTACPREQHHCQRIDDYLRHCLDALPFADSLLASAMRYGLLMGGKRIRPQLVYLVGELLGVPIVQLDAPAAAVECIHAYSLLHDDLPAMDDSPLRRGHPAAHIKFGEAHAILAGDALQTLAFSLLTQTLPASVTPQAQLAMLGELAQASGISGLCYGQSLDLQAEQQPVDVAGLEQIHHYKTAVLIRCAVRLGVLAADQHAQQILPLLDRFANAIGLAFQVQDDLLDVISATQHLGKPQGSDQNHGKNSYPQQLGIEHTHEKVQMLYQEALTTLSLLPCDTTSLEAFTCRMIARDH